MKCSHLRFRSTRTQSFYHNSKRLSRTFFKIFQSFSKPLSKALRYDLRRSRSDLNILAHPTRFVKNFFQLFSTEPAALLFPPSCSRGQLAYISTWQTICQVPNSKFFEFFLSPLPSPILYVGAPLGRPRS